MSSISFGFMGQSQDSNYLKVVLGSGEGKQILNIPFLCKSLQEQLNDISPVLNWMKPIFKF